MKIEYERFKLILFNNLNNIDANWLHFCLLADPLHLHQDANQSPMLWLWGISRSHVSVFQYPSIDPSLYELKDPFIIAMNKFLSTHSLYYFPYQGDNTPEE